MDRSSTEGDAAELESGSAPLLGSSRDAAASAKLRGGIVFDKHGRLRSLTDPRARTTVVVNLASVLERCNEQTLPALYKHVGADLRATPRQLGYVTLAGALTQALCAPLGGVLGHRFDRVTVVSVGALVWGVASLAFAAVRSVPEAMAVWAWNGLGIALLLPNAQSLIADYFSPLSRGKAFGALALTGALGAAGSQLAAGRASVARLGPIEGWRAVFVGVGLVSLAIGALNAAASVDPRTAGREERRRERRRERERRRGEGATADRALERPAGSEGAASERPRGGIGAADGAPQTPESTASRPTVTSFPLSRSPSPGSPTAGPSSPGASAAPFSRSSAPASASSPTPRAPPASNAISAPLLRTRSSSSRTGLLGAPSELREIVRVLTVPSFVVIILQGIVGSTPWNALTFATLYFQLLGLSDGRATFVSACFLLGGAFGSILGGWVGDRAAKRFPNHGRIFAAQFSVLVGIPLAVIIFKGMPVQPGGPWWPGPGNATDALGGALPTTPAQRGPIVAGAAWGEGRAWTGGYASLQNGVAGHTSADFPNGVAGHASAGFPNGVAGHTSADFPSGLLETSRVWAETPLGGLGQGAAFEILATPATASAASLASLMESVSLERIRANASALPSTFSSLEDALGARSTLRAADWLSSVAFQPLPGLLPAHARTDLSASSAPARSFLADPTASPYPSDAPTPPAASLDSLAASYAIANFLWGLLITWAAPACNSPMFAEIVPAQLRSLVYAFDRAFENAIAACGAPFVGYLAERYGFRGLAAASPGSSGSSPPHLEQARALGTAIVLCTAVPWTLCVAFYSALHATYRKDRDRAAADERELEEEENEMEEEADAGEQ